MQTFFEFIDRLDKTIYEYIFIYANPEWLVSVCRILVKSVSLLPFILIFFIIYTKKFPRKSLFLLVSTLILLALSENEASLLKEFFERPRPGYQMGLYISAGAFSFPSAHALNTMAFAAFWSNRFPAAGPLLISLSIIIGLSRMIANFHFPGDILAGWTLGYITGKLFALLIEKTEKNSRVKNPKIIF